ncbi:uncharacterized protein LOC129566591 isoform X3 [Sitodiplosis mosellana]|uniref:uncharacterized protein LOC129566591 isoform X3 n=1 Tax=Sitodiplosis mosellana TaxID=263140 RepID=UPI0024447896|nr:uncharacterized protein LOC129566591 isoform X3 [Sitodiplosis mosellana]
MDQLTEIDRDDLPLLKSLYTPDGSKCYVTYTTIDTYIRWFQTDPNIKHIQFFCLNGDLSRGTFVVTDRRTAYADTLSECTEELLRLLLLIDYSKGYYFTSLNDRTASVREAIKQKNLEINTDHTSLLYYLPKEKALEFVVQPPEGIELKPVTKLSDFQKAFAAWFGADSLSSIRLFQRVGKYNPCVGAFLENETLASWVFRFLSGLLMALQTDKDYFGYGYASLVVRAILKQIAELGHDITAGVLEVNTPSRNLFGKLGFKVIGSKSSIRRNSQCIP